MEAVSQETIVRPSGVHTIQSAAQERSSKKAILQKRERGVELTHWQLASGPLEAGTLASADVTLCPPAPFNPNSSGSTSALMSGNSDMVSILMVI